VRFTTRNHARRVAARSVNAVMTATYWLVGRRIVEQEQQGAERAGYGERLLKRLARDLSGRFGRGFSERNLEQMRAFYLGWPIPQTTATEFLSSRDTESNSHISQTVSAKLMGVSSEAVHRGRASWGDFLPSNNCPQGSLSPFPPPSGQVPLRIVSPVVIHASVDAGTGIVSNSTVFDSREFGHEILAAPGIRYSRLATACPNGCRNLVEIRFEDAGCTALLRCCGCMARHETAASPNQQSVSQGMSRFSNRHSEQHIGAPGARGECVRSLDSRRGSFPARVIIHAA
jgi:DUF1016 N-terminal domain